MKKIIIINIFFLIYLMSISFVNGFYIISNEESISYISVENEDYVNSLWNGETSISGVDGYATLDLINDTIILSDITTISENLTLQLVPNNTIAVKFHVLVKSSAISASNYALIKYYGNINEGNSHLILPQTVNTYISNEITIKLNNGRILIHLYVSSGQKTNIVLRIIGYFIPVEHMLSINNTETLLDYEWYIIIVMSFIIINIISLKTVTISFNSMKIIFFSIGLIIGVRGFMYSVLPLNSIIPIFAIMFFGILNNPIPIYKDYKRGK